MDQDHAGEWIEAYGRAWREGDDAALAGLFGADAVYRSSPFREPAVGTEQIRDYWRTATATQEELELSFGVPIVQGDGIAVEWWATMVDDGSEITLPGALLLRFDESGRCRELREYWHLEEGRHRPPEGWGR